MPDAAQNNSRKNIIPRLSWRVWGIIFAGWTLYGVFFAFQGYLNSAYYGRPMPFGRSLLIWLICAYIWALLTPFIIGLAYRFPVERGHYLSSIALHLVASALIASLQLALYVFARQWLLGDPSRPFSPLQSFQNLVVADFHASLLLYW